ncbi:MAG: MurR/RpiR family transcriptional regulator [Firmicutes bacterium]|nr:MurR/RpiR family transcriptional regulator [Bacillota bacterium]
MYYSINIENKEALVKLRTLRHTLRPAEQDVAELILADPRRVTTMTISQLAQVGNCSEATITRMSKALGYQGFGEMKMAIATELPKNETNLFEAIEPDDSLYSVACKFFGTCIESFNDTLEFLELPQLEEAVAILSNSSRVGCFGSGASGLVANDAQQKLMRVGVEAWSFVDPHNQIFFANGLSPKDAVICISHSGETKDVLESMSVAKASGAKIIGIVGNHRSKLAERSDVFLLALSNELPFKSGSMISRLCQLAIVDLLTLGIAANRKEQILEQFDRNQQAVYRRSMNDRNSR